MTVDTHGVAELTVQWPETEPTSAAHGTLTNAVTEAVRAVGRPTGERVVLAAGDVCATAVNQFDARVRSGARVRPSDSLRLEPARLLAGLATAEDLPAQILADSGTNLEFVTAAWCAAEGAVTSVCVTGGPQEFHVRAERHMRGALQ